LERDMVIGRSDDHAGCISEGSLESQITGPRVFILSDFRTLCDALALALAQASVTVVGASDTPITAAAIAELGPDVLLLDIATFAGLSNAIALRQLLPELRIIAISVAEVEDEIIACAKAGVAGFVSRRESTQDLVTAIHSVLRGEFVCSRRIAALMFTRLAAMSAGRSEVASDNGRGEIPSANGRLTQREQEIISLLCDGLSNKEIARKLKIQNTTVKNHIHSILSKMHMKRRAEVAARFHASGPSPHTDVVPPN
jgi:DNA-binding NarL/FixJ family response regulator